MTTIVERKCHDLLYDYLTGRIGMLVTPDALCLVKLLARAEQEKNYSHNYDSTI